MKNSRFVALDSWRGIAAIMVAVLHFPANSSISSTNFVQNSFMFVDFFFVLSGFIITANYRDKLLSGFGFLKFACLRFGRLWPLHFITLLFIIFIEILSINFGAHRNTVFDGNNSPEALLSAVFLIQSLGISPFAGNGTAWSISTEFWMYLLFALILIYFPKYQTVIISALMILSFSFLFYSESMSAQIQLWTYFARCVLGFLIGVVVYDIFKYVQINQVTTEKYGIHIFTIFELLTVVILTLFLSTEAVPSFEDDTSHINVLAPFLFSFIVYVYAFDLGIVSRILRHSVFMFLGVISYSIYLVHMPLQQWIMGLVGIYVQERIGLKFIELGVGDDGAILKIWGLTNWQGNVATIVMIALVVSVSYISYRCIEEPSRNFFRRMAGKSTLEPMENIRSAKKMAQSS